MGPQTGGSISFHTPASGGFDIDGQQVPWGTTLAELRNLLDQRGLLLKSPHDCFVRARCLSAYGFPAIGMQEEGVTAENRPVCSLVYHLAPYDAAIEIANPGFWADPIGAVLGTPREVYEAEKTQRQGSGEGTVIYHAAWKTGVLNLGLSVFGGQRPEDGGVCAAYLYLGWNDLAAAARPYLPQQQARQARLQALAGNAVQWQRVSLEYELDARLPVEDDGERSCRRALSGDMHYDTPAVWRDQLGEKQLAVWTSPAQALWGVSTRWDTIYFPTGYCPANIEWINFLPGRFGGYMQMQLGILSLMDRHDSNALRLVAEFVGKHSGQVPRCVASRNDG
jgi:hypothetical protein